MALTLIDRAIEVAAKAHREQNRKDTDIPYISHPFAVAMLLMKEGCSEEVILAGLLHDTLEDTDIESDFICSNFGENVAAIVTGCSEPDKSLSWEDRKKHTLEVLTNASREIKLVVCADKLHNIRSVASGYQELGEKVWERFKRGKSQQEWYHKGLVKALCNQLDGYPEGSIFHQFADEVDTVFRLGI